MFSSEPKLLLFFQYLPTTLKASIFVLTGALYMHFCNILLLILSQAVGFC
jgi:hypothetical protein